MYWSNRSEYVLLAIEESLATQPGGSPRKVFTMVFRPPPARSSCVSTRIRGLAPRTGALLFLAAALSRGATFTVTTTADSCPGSLRQAITDANGAAGLDTIASNV